MAEPKDDVPTKPADLKPADEQDEDKGVGDGVPRTYASDTKEGKEKTSFGGDQGGD